MAFLHSFPLQKWPTPGACSSANTDLTATLFTRRLVQERRGAQAHSSAVPNTAASEFSTVAPTASGSASPSFSPFVESRDWERDILGIARYGHQTSNCPSKFAASSEDHRRECERYASLLHLFWDNLIWSQESGQEVAMRSGCDFDFKRPLHMAIRQH